MPILGANRHCRDELENEQAVFFVAEDETGRLMGYTGMHVVLGECYMDNLAVDHHFAIRAWAGRFCRR